MTDAQGRTAAPMVSGNRWVLLLRGVAAVFFGLSTLIWPGLTLAVLVIIYGAYAVVDGAFAVVAGFRSPAGTRRRLFFAEGALGILAGLVALFWPGITAIVLLYIISFWAIFGGLLRIVTAVLLRGEIENMWAMIANGTLWVLLGIILGALPGVGLLSLAWLIGVFALGAGVTLIWLAIRVRGQRAGGGDRVS